HSCRIRVDRAPRHLFLPDVVGLGPRRVSTIVEWFKVEPSTAGGARNHATVERANWFNLEPSVARSRRQEGALVIPARLRRRFGLAKGPPSSLRKPRRGSSSDPPRSRWRCTPWNAGPNSFPPTRQGLAHRRRCQRRRVHAPPRATFGTPIPTSVSASPAFWCCLRPSTFVVPAAGPDAPTASAAHRSR